MQAARLRLRQRQPSRQGSSGFRSSPSPLDHSSSVTHAAAPPRQDHRYISIYQSHPDFGDVPPPPPSRRQPHQGTRLVQPATMSLPGRSPAAGIPGCTHVGYHALSAADSDAAVRRARADSGQTFVPKHEKYAADSNKPPAFANHSLDLEQARDVDGDGDTCIVCMEVPPQVAFRPCGHVATCKVCAEKIWAKTRECPLCRCQLVQVCMPV